MAYISDTQLARTQDYIAGLETKTARIRAAAAQKAAEATVVAEVVGGAAAMGFLRSKFEKDDGTFNVPGTSIDIQLAVGLGGVLLAIAGTFGSKYDEHILAVSSGILATWSAQVAEKTAKTGEFTMVGAPEEHGAMTFLP